MAPKSEYAIDCCGCDRSLHKDEKKVPGGIIDLGDYWVLNHYCGKEGFLGWLALQPRYHRMSLGELKKPEAQSLGTNILKIHRGLDEYWSKAFPRDRLRRIYVVYFFESVHDIPTPSPFHLHIHIIPRPESFDKLLREYIGPGSAEACSSTINAWKISTLSKLEGFPKQYRMDKNKPKITALMKYLKRELGKKSNSIDTRSHKE